MLVKNIIKAVLLGDFLAGKTAIRNHCLGDEIDSKYLKDVGADFGILRRTIESVDYRIQLWDFAGSPKPNQVKKYYYLGASAGIIVYDISNPASFYTVLDWIEELWSRNGLGPVPIIVAGNKSDLQSSLSVSPDLVQQQCQNFSDRTKGLGFMVRAIESSKIDRRSLDTALDALWHDVVTYMTKIGWKLQSET